MLAQYGDTFEQSRCFNSLERRSLPVRLRGYDAGNCLLIDFFFRGLREAAGECLITDGLQGFQKSQECVNLLPGTRRR